MALDAIFSSLLHNLEFVSDDLHWENSKRIENSKKK